MRLWQHEPNSTNVMLDEFVSQIDSSRWCIPAILIHRCVSVLAVPIVVKAAAELMPGRTNRLILILLVRCTS